MDDVPDRQQAVELLQQLGLKEYEAESFVALSRLPKATAKRIGEVSAVPRTRVYDAVRVLESKGLVEIQHSNPKQFRAVPVEEAAEILQAEYDSRVETLRETLRNLDSVDGDDEAATAHEVWSLSGRTAVRTRVDEMVADADREVVVVLGHESAVEDSLFEDLRAAADRGVTVVVGARDESIRDRVAEKVPDAESFVSGLDWLTSPPPGDGTEIGRLALVDRSAILVSTVHETAGGDAEDERAVYGDGFDNGLVAVARRLMATGLLPDEDPG